MATQPHQPNVPESPSRKGPGAPMLLLALAVVAVIVAGIALILAGKGSTTKPAASVQAQAPSRYSGSVASPTTTEPPLKLRNYKGEGVDIRQYHGKAVFVTFIYTHCPDVCPIIASNLGVALNLMGAKQASKVQVIAVSVDPRGDTKTAIVNFLHRRGVFGRMQYLVGDPHELASVWKAWGVGSDRDASNPELVNHSGLVYGITAAGKIATLYAANFRPQEIVHDAPLLASS